MSYARIEEGWRIRCREKRCCYLYKACCSSGAAGLYKQFVGRWGGVGSGDSAGGWSPPERDYGFRIGSKLCMINIGELSLIAQVW